MQLSQKTIAQLTTPDVLTPAQGVFTLPEKILQFGTGVLLRGLPDYFIDKANRQNCFNGRIVVVKSTTGDTDAFNEQNGLYTLCIRGVEAGTMVSENRVCAAISRVLSAATEWKTILECAKNPELQVIISNTTEVGIQLQQESIFQNPPQSFPAKLLAFLYERFKKLGAVETSGIIVLPTELLSENGKKLQAIVVELAHFNNLDATFLDWLETKVRFCNTLVDCIVPGKSDAALQQQLEQELGYTDALLTMSEVYRLWAIEGDADIKEKLAFAETDSRVIVTPDITPYKELKLRLLNGTHTLSCGLAHLAGIGTVKEAMEDGVFACYIEQVMLHELAPAIPYALPEGAALHFGNQVLDRFRNPHIRHLWLNITMQYSSKMAQRVVPVLLQYYTLFQKVPPHIALGMAAYLLFMKSVAHEGNIYWGESNGTHYRINDDQSAFYFNLWQSNHPEMVVQHALQNKSLWGSDLTNLPEFTSAVTKQLQQLLQHGVQPALQQLEQTG